MYRHCVLFGLLVVMVGMSLDVVIDRPVSGILHGNLTEATVFSINENGSVDVYKVNQFGIVGERHFMIPERMEDYELEVSKGAPPRVFEIYGNLGVLFIAEVGKIYGEEYTTFLYADNFSTELSSYIDFKNFGDLVAYVQKTTNGYVVYRVYRVPYKVECCEILPNMSLGKCITFPEEIGSPRVLYMRGDNVIFLDEGSNIIYKYLSGNMSVLFDSGEASDAVAFDYRDGKIYAVFSPPDLERNRKKCVYAIFDEDFNILEKESFNCSKFPSGSYVLRVFNSTAFLLFDGRYLYASKDFVHWMRVAEYEKSFEVVGDYLALIKPENTGTRIVVEKFPIIEPFSDLLVELVKTTSLNLSKAYLNATLKLWVNVGNNGSVPCNRSLVSFSLDNKELETREVSLNPFSSKTLVFLYKNVTSLPVGTYNFSVNISSDECVDEYLKNNQLTISLSIEPLCDEGSIKGDRICKGGRYIPCDCSIPECKELLNCTEIKEIPERPVIKEESKKFNIVTPILIIIFVILVIIILLKKLKKGENK